MTQVVHPVDRERKRELLAHLIRTGVIDQALVFTRTKHGANRLAEQLAREGIAAIAIHGNKSQGQRVRALADFKSGRTPILVATEIAARGLDIDSLPHVVNFELPMVPEDYVHRIGRTGRAGLTGHAVSLVCVDEMKLLHDIERVLGAPIPSEVIQGFEPDRSIRPEPILRGGLGRARPTGHRPQAPRPAGHRPNGPRPHAPRHAPERAWGGEAPARHQGARPNGAPSNGPRRHDGRPPSAQQPRGPRPDGARPGTSIGQHPNGSQPRGPRPQVQHASGSQPRGSRPHGSRPQWDDRSRPPARRPALPGERLSKAGRQG